MEAKADNVGRVAKKPRTFFKYARSLSYRETDNMSCLHSNSLWTGCESKIEETVRMVISNG